MVKFICIRMQELTFCQFFFIRYPAATPCRKGCVRGSSDRKSKRRDL